MSYATIEVDEVIAETDAAFLFALPDGSQEWVPKSVIEDAESIGKGDTSIEVNVAEWFAEKEGLV